MGTIAVPNDLLESKLERAECFLDGLEGCAAPSEKLTLLRRYSLVDEWMSSSVDSLEIPLQSEVALFSLLALKQNKVFFRGVSSFPDREQLCVALQPLVDVESFYDSIGGIVGYYASVLRLLLGRGGSLPKGATLHRPEAVDISDDDSWDFVGLERLSMMAELYPVGGAGDRLNLVCAESGEGLPAATLQYDGKTLLSRLIRDLQAREYLCYQVNGEVKLTPVALMTSPEKYNDILVREMCEKERWFGRPKEMFRFFRQPLVPLVTETGDFAMAAPLVMHLKPGGHGAVWKLANDTGVLDWLLQQGRKKLLIRQINNPMAGVDAGLLRFVAVGLQGDKTFGFASCERRVGAPEGMDVVVLSEAGGRQRRCLTNVEYTDFSPLGIEDQPEFEESPYSRFPCNTNILFADIAEASEAAKKAPVPGMVVNLKSSFPCVGDSGEIETKRCARLESTMQNLADQFWKEGPADERGGPTYITYYPRQKTFSVTKRLQGPDQSLFDTPAGCYLDQLRASEELLRDHCAVSVPELVNERCYREDGPNWVLRYHPALGPLFRVIGSKVRGGRLAHGAELELEIADLDMEDLTLDGSFRVLAQCPLGCPDEQGIIHYDKPGGRAILKGVTVRNRGIDRRAMKKRAVEGMPPPYWTGAIDRVESFEVIIEGSGEFIAEGVTFVGPRRIVVPSGTRVTAYQRDGTVELVEQAIDPRLRPRSQSGDSGI